MIHCNRSDWRYKISSAARSMTAVKVPLFLTFSHSLGMTLWSVCWFSLSSILEPYDERKREIESVRVYVHYRDGERGKRGSEREREREWWHIKERKEGRFLDWAKFPSYITPPGSVFPVYLYALFLTDFSWILLKNFWILKWLLFQSKFFEFLILSVFFKTQSFTYFRSFDFFGPA